MQLPSTAVVILNWNGWRDTIQCLESMRSPGHRDLHVVVVDNGSEDQSIEKLQDWAASRGEVLDNVVFGTAEATGSVGWAHEAPTGGSDVGDPFSSLSLIACRVNRGYAGGINVGIECAIRKGAEYILLLNNDTIVDAELVPRLIRGGQSDESIGVLGPTILEHGSTGVVQSVGGTMSLWTGRGKLLGSGQAHHEMTSELSDVDWVSGAAFMLKREAVEKVGLLDEQFFLTYEETDYCFRARREGFRVVVVPEATVQHRGGASMAGSVADYHLTKNRAIFMKKNASTIQLPVFVWCYVLGSMRRAIVHRLAGDREAAWAVLRGLASGVQSVFGWLIGK